MGLDPITWAVIASAVVGTASYVDAKEARGEQKASMQAQAKVQGQIQSEQKASNVAAAANERRQQIREARVRRSRVMQTSSNTGTTGSSGEVGALGSLSTGLSSNIGSNLGQIETANRVTELGQTAADFGTAANIAGVNVQDATSMFQLSTSIFSSLGGPEAAIKAIK
jgi:hypothetical protein